MPLVRLIPVLALAAGFTAHAARADVVSTPPATPTQAAATVWHGVTVNDPYRWLEDAASPAVRDWIAAQNRHTEAVLGAMPDGKAMNERVRQLAITSTTRSGPLLAGGTLFYLQQTPPQSQPVLVAQAWPEGAARTLVDQFGRTGLVCVAVGEAEDETVESLLHFLQRHRRRSESRGGRRAGRHRDTRPYAGCQYRCLSVAEDAPPHIPHASRSSLLRTDA